MKHIASALTCALAVLFAAVNGHPLEETTNLVQRNSDGHIVSRQGRNCGYLTTGYGGSGEALLMQDDGACHIFEDYVPELDNKLNHFNVLEGCMCQFYKLPTCSQIFELIEVGPKERDFRTEEGDYDNNLSAYRCHDTTTITEAVASRFEDRIDKRSTTPEVLSSPVDAPLNLAERAEPHGLSKRANTCGYVTTEHGGEGTYLYIYLDELCHVFPQGIDDQVSFIYIWESCACYFWIDPQCTGWPDVYGLGASQDLTGKYDNSLSAWYCRSPASDAEKAVYSGEAAQNVVAADEGFKAIANITSRDARDPIPCVECPCDGIDGPCHCVDNGCCCEVVSS